MDSFKQYLHDADEHVGSELAERILGGGPSLAQLEEYEARHASLHSPGSASAAMAPSKKARAAAKAGAAAPAAVAPAPAGPEVAAV